VKTRGAALRTVGLIAAVGVGIGAGAVLAVIPAPTPENLVSTAGSGSVNVVERAFTDPRVVQVVAKAEESLKATSAASGTLRAYDCRPGVPLRSGEPVLVADDRPVIVLHLSRPPWRDLAAGTHGDDVLELQTELSRLGYNVAQDGRFGRLVEVAVEDLWRRAGAGPHGEGEPLDRPEPLNLPHDVHPSVKAYASLAVSIFEMLVCSRLFW